MQIRESCLEIAFPCHDQFRWYQVDFVQDQNALLFQFICYMVIEDRRKMEYLEVEYRKIFDYTYRIPI
jgi:hypothetical protein